MNQSYLIAGALTVALVGWMASGLLQAEAPSSQDNVARTEPASLTSVQAQTVRARSIVQYVSVHGSVEPERRLVVRAETAGRVAAVVVRQGERVKAGDVIVRLAMKDREARLTTAKARVVERDGAYQAAKRLHGRGHSTKRRVEELYSQLQSALAEVQQAKLEVSNTEIRAPFAGVLNVRKVEVGDYVGINGEIATIVDADPLLVRVQVPQHDVGRIKQGAATEILLATGRRTTGRVRYVSSDADQDTRTFRVEIEVENADSSIPSGLSAEARIAAGKTQAHFVSAAVLTLDDKGQVGIKVAGRNDIVAFHPVKVVKSSNKGLWVTGLPPQTRIITVGHGFVRVGQRVAVSEQLGMAVARDDASLGGLSTFVLSQ